MADRVTLYVVALIVATGVTIAIGGYAWFAGSRRRGEGSTATLLAVLMATTAVWSFASAMTYATADARFTLGWHFVAGLATFTISVVWFLFALEYAGYGRYVSRRLVAALAVVPVLTAGGFATNGHHGWFYRSVDVVADGTVIVRSLGWLYHAHLAYAYTLIFAGVVLMLRFAYDSRRLYRGQAITVALGTVLPVVANVAFQVGLGPDEYNLTPVSFTLMGLFFAAAVFRYRFLDVVPVARESVIETMRDGVVVVDPGGRVVDVNATADRLLRTTDDADVVGAGVGRVRLGDRTLRSLLRGLRVDEEPGGETPARSGEAWNGDGTEELAIETAEGRRYVTGRATPLPSPVDDRDSQGTLLLLRDVTGRRRTEKRYQRLIENASDMVTVLESDGTIRYQSPAVEQVLGYDPEAMVGDVILEYVHPADREAAVGRFEGTAGSVENRIRVEFRLRHADGGWRIVEATGRNLTDDPHVQGIVVNSRDVTEKRLHERELARTNERLDEFASVVSHDLRNPLNVADGYLERLDERVDEDAIDVVREQHDRMHEIIGDALALAREGGTVDDPQPVDLETVARVAWENVETADAADLTVAGTRTIEADRDRLLRALENLVRNAVEHAGPDVTVGVGATDDGFYVADDGPGIPADDRERIFESGYTTDSNGTGFGLAIVAEIAAAHGWTVSATDDDGARFEFDLAGDADPVEEAAIADD